MRSRVKGTKAITWALKERNQSEQGIKEHTSKAPQARPVASRPSTSARHSECSKSSSRPMEEALQWRQRRTTTDSKRTRRPLMLARATRGPMPSRESLEEARESQERKRTDGC